MTLFTAARAGDAAKVREQLARKVALIGIRVTPAVHKKHPEFEEGATALHLASRYGHAEVVEILLPLKVDVDATTASGATALHLAAAGDHADIVALLLDAHANPSVADLLGSTPLFEAASHGFDDVVRLLISRNAPATVRNKENLSALHLATYCGSLDTVKLLLQAKADVNAQDDRGRTPMHLAVVACEPSPGHHPVNTELVVVLIQYLLEHGADPNLQDANGEGAFDLLMSLSGQSKLASHRGLVDSFRAHGAQARTTPAGRPVPGAPPMPGAKAGTQPGTQTGAKSGIQAAVKSGTQSGVQPGIKPGTAAGLSAASLPGPASGTAAALSAPTPAPLAASSVPASAPGSAPGTGTASPNRTGPAIPGKSVIRSSAGIGNALDDRVSWGSAPIALGERSVTIGRDADCDVRYLSRTLSRVHAKVERTSKGFVISDMGSRNGILIDQIKITGPTVLKPNQVVELGAYEFRFDGFRLMPIHGELSPEQLAAETKRTDAAQAGKSTTLSPNQSAAGGLLSAFKR
ncbi:MAG: ankyrin repeat domain-containing protein [Planctomycetota bacterium]|nr:ankyrin repeat domain-containing protein [Planctomycetota bacterium]